MVPQLYKMYSSNDPPPIELIRMPQLLCLLIKALFKPGAVVNPDHKHKYIFLLAFATCAHETWRKVSILKIVKDKDKVCTHKIFFNHSNFFYFILCLNISSISQFFGLVSNFHSKYIINLIFISSTFSPSF